MTFEFLSKGRNSRGLTTSSVSTEPSNYVESIAVLRSIAIRLLSPYFLQRELPHRILFVFVHIRFLSHSLTVKI